MVNEKELVEELFNAKSVNVIYLEVIKMLYIKNSIYSLFLCTMLFVSLLEAIFSRNAIFKIAVLAIALVMELWVAYRDIKSIGETKREANVIAEQILSQDEIRIGR